MKRKVFLLIIWGGLLIMFAVILGFALKKQGNTLCQKVQISINYPTGDYFVSEQDIKDDIASLGDSIRGSKLSNIDIETLESLILRNPYIEKAEVFMTLDGIVNIHVRQRKPIVRVHNQRYESYYISEDGAHMPVNQGKPAHVPVASGYIFENFMPGVNLATIQELAEDSAILNSVLYQVFRVALHISQDPFLSAHIEQIYINSKQEIELIPLVGNHLILLGSAVKLEEKFENLLIFYKDALPKEGWDTYNIINLKFDNQVVCTKNKAYSYGI